MAEPIPTSPFAISPSSTHTTQRLAMSRDQDSGIAANPHLQPSQNTPKPSIDPHSTPNTLPASDWFAMRIHELPAHSTNVLASTPKRVWDLQIACFRLRDFPANDMPSGRKIVTVAGGHWVLGHFQKLRLLEYSVSARSLTLWVAQAGAGANLEPFR